MCLGFELPEEADIRPPGIDTSPPVALPAVAVHGRRLNLTIVAYKTVFFERRHFDLGKWKSRLPQTVRALTHVYLHPNRGSMVEIRSRLRSLLLSGRPQDNGNGVPHPPPPEPSSQPSRDFLVMRKVIPYRWRRSYRLSEVVSSPVTQRD